MKWIHLFFRRVCNMPSSNRLTEQQLRSLSHKELLAYSLTHLPLDTPSHLKHYENHKSHSNKRQTSGEPPRKKPRIFDMARYGQRHIALRIAYTGWRFHGFASQINVDNTVEAYLFSSLLKTKLISSREDCEYSRAGRTDVGVSAANQVVGLRLRSNVRPPSSGAKEIDYMRVINSTLPEGIRCTAWSPVSDGTSQFPTLYDGDPPPIKAYWNSVREGNIIEQHPVRRPGQTFSARFDAVWRTYKYFFVKGNLDITAMREAALHFVGKHNFRNFCRIDEHVTNFERLLYSVNVRRMNDDAVCLDDGDDEYTVYYIFVKGQAFLWHQVRCMAAVMFDVGMKRERPDIIKRMLEDAKNVSGTFSNGKPSYRMASPVPLLLHECTYPKTVLSFPQSFERDFTPPDLDDSNLRRNNFEKADQSITQDFASSAAKTSILKTLLRDHDEFIGSETGFVPNESPHMSRKRKSFKHFRKTRDFLLDHNAGGHIPYDLRAAEECLQSKQKNLVLK